MMARCRMRGRVWRRGAALAAVVGVLGGQAGMAGAIGGRASGAGGLGGGERTAPAAMADEERERAARQPVVMVGDLWGGEAGLGVPGPGSDPGGLYSVLRSRGYVPGRTLFWLVPSPGTDLLRIARTLLPRAVQEARARSGAEKVDVVALGAGALAARLYVELGGGHRHVDALVMVRPPLRGSRLITAYRELGLVEAAAVARRASGRGRGEELVLGAARTPFSSEVDYLDEVAYRFFEPLYGEFVADVEATPPGRRAGPVSFPAWFRRQYPADYRAAFLEAALPPLLEDAPRGRVEPSQEPGRALSRAYLNAVALEVARQNYRRSEPWLRVAASGWERDLVWEGDWRTTLAEFLLRRAAALAGEWSRRKGAELARQALLAGAGVLTGVPARDPSLHHLVAEEDDLPGAPGRNPALVANAALRTLNLAAASREKGEGPGLVRYVAVVGVPPRWLSALLPPEARDRVERQVEEQLLVPALLDEVVLDAGLVPLAGVGPVGVGRQTWSTAAARLDLDVGRRPAQGAGDGALTLEGGGVARVREPWLVAVPIPGEEEVVAAPARGVRPGRVEVTVEPLARPPARFRFASFVVWADAQGAARIVPLGRERGGDGRGLWRAVLPAGRAESGRYRLLLGARLLPPRDGQDRSTLLLEGQALAFRYRVRMVTAGGERPARHGAGGTVDRGAAVPGQRPFGGGGTSTAGGEGGTPARPRRRVMDGVAAQPARDQRTPQAPPRRGDPAGQPVAEPEEEIVATYRNKHTSLLQEDRTYHVRWEWDFGDGTTWVDDDPGHVVSRVRHAFQPGVYVVRARSWSNKGSLLREVVMTVRVGPGGARVTLTTDRARLPGAGEETSSVPAAPDGVELVAETAREPPVSLDLSGPRAWVTGRAALFRLSAMVGQVPHLEGVSVVYDPGPAFAVRWRKPGTFRVRGAARVTLTYRFPEGVIRIRNVYVVERAVEVLAPSVTG